jgi:hypothetical protein
MVDESGDGEAKERGSGLVAMRGGRCVLYTGEEDGEGIWDSNSLLNEIVHFKYQPLDLFLPHVRHLYNEKE